MLQWAKGLRVSCHHDLHKLRLAMRKDTDGWEKSTERGECVQPRQALLLRAVRSSQSSSPAITGPSQRPHCF
jgi:hypothetical protein